jgi:hypothetical protein
VIELGLWPRKTRMLRLTLAHSVEANILGHHTMAMKRQATGRCLPLLERFLGSARRTITTLAQSHDRLEEAQVIAARAREFDKGNYARPSYDGHEEREITNARACALEKGNYARAAYAGLGDGLAPLEGDGCSAARRRPRRKPKNKNLERPTPLSGRERERESPSDS